jgi:hypothetical protein
VDVFENQLLASEFSSFIETGHGPRITEHTAPPLLRARLLGFPPDRYTDSQLELAAT